jgi:hypothetical protein
MKLSYKFFLTATVCIFIGTIAQAQYRYKLTHSTGVYEPVAQGLIISAPDENEEHWDENGFVFELDEPFTFPDVDEPYTVGIVYTNGEVVLIGDGDQPTRYLFPLSVDLVDKRIFGAGGNSEIIIGYENGITKIEWVDASTFCAVIGLAEQEGISFALWLYHDTGIFEYHYGPNTFSNSTENCMYGPLEFKPQIGIADVDQSFEFLKAFWVIGDPYNPELAFTDDPFFDEYVESLPKEGLIYRFTYEVETSTRAIETEISAIVAPNPVSDALWISSKSLQGGEVVRISDTHGRVVHQSLWQSQQPIDMQRLMSGIYFLEITTSEGVIKRKILKQ